jgi:hypothetical protein
MNSDVMSIYLYDVNIVEKLYTSYNNIFTDISVFEAMMYYMSKVISNLLYKYIVITLSDFAKS